MALEGQLSDFGLAEIFQLIAGQQKSGFLTLEARHEMVFVFDKGVLISTRDRRGESFDWLEKHLRDYGYFTDDQWRHIEFVRANASLDLTEIVISEGLLQADELQRVLGVVAQELTFEGMKLSRGRYHFAATRGSPERVRGRIALDVQGLLMEGARRLDEEPHLAEFFPTPLMTFAAGHERKDPGVLPELDARLLALALGGEPLGRILKQGRADGFLVRERLKELCESGLLRPVTPEAEAAAAAHGGGAHGEPGREHGLRSLPLTVLCALLLLAAGWARWAPLVTAGRDLGGGLDERSGAVRPDAVALTELRLAQIRDEVASALEIHRRAHGRYPADLEPLVREGLLPEPTYRVVQGRRWRYEAPPDGSGYRLAG